MAKKSILDHFPKKLIPRDVQKNTLLALQEHWDKADIFVVNLPVASGKSAISVTLASWLKKASIITPSKLLVDQYKDEYGYLHVLRAKADYWCETFNCPLTKRPQQKKLGKTCKKDLGCLGCMQYLRDLRKARVMPYLLSNYYIYLAHQLYRDSLIIDEAHCLTDVLKQMASKKLWHFQYKWPTNIKTTEQLKEWINSLPPESFKRRGKASGDTLFGVVQSNLIALKEELNSYRPTYLIDITTDTYKDEEYDCIKMVPLDISDHPPIMWPNQVKKIILLSATISRKDIEQIGLSGRKIQYIQADSPINAERRPIIIPQESKSMAMRVQDNNLPDMISYISDVSHYHKDEKGVIHVTYSLAKKLKQAEFPKDVSDRLIFHSKQDKTKRYNEFRDSKEPKILVACGMYEGIDLAYDAGRWQIIAKVPWPNLGNPAIKYMCEKDDAWYTWEALKTIMQGCGRICRTPTDYGATYVYDITVKRLYESGIKNNLIPDWFKNSIRWEI